MKKCKLCGRGADGSFGMCCGKCDTLIGDAMLDLKAELDV